MVLTKSEMEIMDVLWDCGRPMSRSDLLECSEDKSWKDSSVHILLNGLLAKGAIYEAGFVKRNKTYGRVFLPSMTREAYFATTIFSHNRKPDIMGLMTELLNNPALDDEKLSALEEMIANRLNHGTPAASSH